MCRRSGWNAWGVSHIRQVWFAVAVFAIHRSSLSRHKVHISLHSPRCQIVLEHNNCLSCQSTCLHRDRSGCWEQEFLLYFYDFMLDAIWFLLSSKQCYTCLCPMYLHLCLRTLPNYSRWPKIQCIISLIIQQTFRPCLVGMALTM